MGTKIPSAFMEKPGHCIKEGGQDKTGDVTIIDTSVCHWCCDVECSEYITFHEAQMAEKKRLKRMRKEASSMVEELPVLEF